MLRADKEVVKRVKKGLDHARMYEEHQIGPGTFWTKESSHERIIDGDNKDLTGGFQFRAVDVTGYVGCGA